MNVQPFVVTPDRYHPALNVLGISPLWLEAISGFLLLLAITLDRVISLRLQAALRRRSSGVGT